MTGHIGAPAGPRAGTRLVAAFALWILPGAMIDASAAPYPDHQIRIISSFPAGTAMDTVARIIGPRLAEALGQPVVVENRPGASGNIGSELAAKAAPDGYTLVLAWLTITRNPAIIGDAAVDPVRRLLPMTKLTTQPVVIVASPSFPAN